MEKPKHHLMQGLLCYKFGNSINSHMSARGVINSELSSFQGSESLRKPPALVVVVIPRVPHTYLSFLSRNAGVPGTMVLMKKGWFPLLSSKPPTMLKPQLSKFPLLRTISWQK